MRIVIALGGNALLKRGQILSVENQRANMRAVAEALARGCRGHEIVIVHGNGPQVGLLALEANAYKAVAPYPLDVLGAESQGMIGYIIAQELRNARVDWPIAAFMTQTLVDENDPAFNKPTKPIGPIYTVREIDAFEGRGWTFAPDGMGMRRVVPSPNPIDIVELPIAEQLLAAGITVICAGGGGVPVCRESNGKLKGVEAVIDKDLAAALFAVRTQADKLVILTDVDAVYLDWTTPKRRPVRSIRSPDLRHHSFDEGSMGPKVTAACNFVERTGHATAIGSLWEAEAVLSGEAGTVVIQ
jgi:carbamate kinase